MKLELNKEINWSQYVHSINHHHKPAKVEYGRDRLTSYNRHIRLRRNPSFKVIKDLSSTIDHSVMLYNQIKNTNSFSEHSQTKLKNDLTTASTSRFPQLSKQPSNYKHIYKTEINHPYSSSGNKINTIYSDTSRVESLSVFKNKITEERMGAIVNKLSTDSLVNQYLIKDNDKESLDIQISYHLKNRDLFTTFMKEFKSYHLYILRQKGKEDKIKSDLKEKLNELKVEIQRMKLKKSKLMKKMDTLFMMKLFLLSVKNRTNKIEDFSHKCLNEHKKDLDRQKLIFHEYKKIGTIKIKKSNVENKKDLSLTTIGRLKREMIEYFPKKNESIFTKVDDFILIFDELKNRFIHLLNQQNDLNEECHLMKEEYNEINLHNNVNEIEEIKFDKKMEDKEANLTQMKEKNIALEAIKQSILKMQTKSLHLVQNKIRLMHKEVDCLFPIQTHHKAKEKSPYILYLEEIENGLNYLLNRKVKFYTKDKESYFAFQRILHSRNKEKQVALKMKIKEKKLIEKIKKINARKNKISKLVKKKVAEKYSPLNTKAKSDNSKQNNKMNTIFNEYD